jgi:hypothetical protein
MPWPLYTLAHPAPGFVKPEDYKIFGGPFI